CQSLGSCPTRRDGKQRNTPTNLGLLTKGRQAMELLPREKDKLLLSLAAMVAERRKDRGVLLNYPEAVALISCAILEGARDGRSVAELMSLGTTVLRREEVMS